MNMRFVIDESSWKFDQLSQQASCEMLEQLMDQIELAQKHNHGVCYSEELFWQAVWQDKTFYELGPHNGQFSIPRETIERLSSLVNHLPVWQDLSVCVPANSEIQIKGNTHCSSSIAWAQIQTLSNPKDAVAALTMGTKYTAGCYEVEHNGASGTVWLVGDHSSFQEFFRWLVRNTCSSPADLAKLAPSAFIKLDFHSEALLGIRKMAKPFHDLLPILILHFATLSDHGKEIFSGDWAEAQARFRSHGVDLSPENGNTKANSQAKKQRTVRHDGNEVICWWHSKLEPHQNRIHFYPDDVKATGRILIGICCKHLDT